MKVKTSAHLTSKLPHGVESFSPNISKSLVSGSGRQLAKLPYIILDNHISKPEALHLLGRVVYNVRRPLECYVPSRTSICASPHSLGVCNTTESSISGSSTPNPAFAITAQDVYPNYDASLFVLPNLPLSVSESTSATLSAKSNYSSRTQSLLSSLLGLSFSLQKAASKTFMLNAKVLRVLSLNQHSEVFSKLMGFYGKEIKRALKKAGGTMYFVVGVKISTDATMETREEDQRSVAGKVMLNATQLAGLGTQATSGIELGQVLNGRDVQKELESATTEDVMGERAFAMEYCCVQLRRKLEFAASKRDEEWARISALALEAQEKLDMEYQLELERASSMTPAQLLQERYSAIAKMVPGDSSWHKELEKKKLAEQVARAKWFNSGREDRSDTDLGRDLLVDQENARRRLRIFTYPYGTYPYETYEEIDNTRYTYSLAPKQAAPEPLPEGVQPPVTSDYQHRRRLEDYSPTPSYGIDEDIEIIPQTYSRKHAAPAASESPPEPHAHRPFRRRLADYSPSSGIDEDIDIIPQVYSRKHAAPAASESPPEGYQPPVISDYQHHRSSRRRLASSSIGEDIDIFSSPRHAAPAASESPPEGDQPVYENLADSFSDEDDDELEVVLDDEVLLETFDCLG